VIVVSVVSSVVVLVVGIVIGVYIWKRQHIQKKRRGKNAYFGTMQYSLCNLVDILLL
jgi:hypothetical protein